MAQHLILTHEQADFDALGALLGAALLDEHAIPVLPRRMNRNCRAFCNVYGAHLPFVNPGDLPQETIATITLVDTQSLTTLKGLNTRTQIRVIDHHTLRPDLPPDWQVRLDQTGSCTTLFVEALLERDSSLPPILATLLLLGIYEDTGSLLYSATTARDAAAVSFLLGQGASLEIAARYLNPALSAEQRGIYNRLLSDAETITIHGQTLIVAAAEGGDGSDEISTIAHKLRDLLDPAALFILVRTSEGVRLVARSTTDTVDVSTLAAHFGGGGHDRAAAALVRLPAGSAAAEDALLAARAALVHALPEHVRPSATVRQLMSRHPRMLSPEATLEEAARMMQRYGYEGFPVVESGRVVGLLTRRAVDRAIAHRLSLKVGSLMEAGEVSVRSDDSIDHLQDVMGQSGWGQIPVLDAAGEIAGIVTRTDLLKHLSARSGAPGRDNLAGKLDQSLPPARLALLHAVAAEAYARHYAIYIVGGFVRDLILDRPGTDFDIVVEGDAITLGRALERRFGGRILSHARFGTAKWTLSAAGEDFCRALSATTASPAHLSPSDLPAALDLISARTEFYDYPTALPTIERSGIKLDLHRRDFTINTLALRLDGGHYGELYDFWGGLSDLRKGVVRVLHSLSFVDDPTRQLRAVRFEQRFDFTIETRTLQLMAESTPLIRNLSGDRLRHELNLILSEPRALAMLNRLSELGLLAAIHPDLPDPRQTPGLEARLERALFSPPPPAWDLADTIAGLSRPAALTYLVWLAGLPAETASAVAQRLRLPGALSEMLAAAARLRETLPALDPAERPSRLVARFDPIPRPALYALYLLQEPAPAASLLRAYAETWRHIMPVANGESVRAAGLPPGPVYRDLLSRLRAAWLDGEFNELADEERLFEKLLREYTAGSIQPTQEAQ